MLPLRLLLSRGPGPRRLPARAIIVAKACPQALPGWRRQHQEQQHQHQHRAMMTAAAPASSAATATAAGDVATTRAGPAGGRQGGGKEGHRKPGGVVDFEDTATAYSALKTVDLVRAYLVFRLCGFRPLVTHADAVLRASYRLLGTWVTESVVRATFFRHFCAGETAATIRPRVGRLRQAGVAGILDYAAEADIHSMASPAQAPTQTAYVEGEITCRVYDYESERRCDLHVATFLDCIDAVKDVTPEGFAAIKVTALGNPKLLERMSACILEVRRLFHRFDTEGKGYITRAQFKDGYNKFFVPASSPSSSSSSSSSSPSSPPLSALDPVEQLLARLDPNKTDRIDYIEWSNTLSLQDVPELTSRCRETGPLKLAALSAEETQLMLAMQARLDQLARRARSLGVRLMIDAEQTYFQPAIDNIVCQLQRRYNRDYPVIFGTYQCYLKDAQSRLQDDMARAERQGYRFAAKLVRGAYMVSERKRAQEMGYPSPIHDTIEDTHATYDGAVALALEAMAGGKKVEILIASHNQTSIEKTLAGMDALGLEPNSSVYFGQLLGMADHLTLSLGRYGYKAYKYVPYGRVGEVLPYLIRRAQENSDVLGGVGRELTLLRKEIRRRVLPF